LEPENDNPKLSGKHLNKRWKSSIY